MTDFVCKKCGSTEYEIKDKLNGTGIAHGLYCAKCGFWHKWLGKDELKKMTIIKPQEKCYSIDEVNHLIAEKDKLIQKLQSENAALRERLDRSVELPCKVGDMVYSTDNVGEKIYEAQIRKIIYDLWHMAFDDSAINQSIFLTKEAAEARLKELQEGKK